jgi:biopolymer transport protein ExbD
MAFRDTLLTSLTTSLASTSVGVSSELPFNSGDVRLDIKNKKTLYIDQDNVSKEVLYNTLAGDVYQTTTSINAFLTVDAKNQPSDIESITNTIREARLVVTGPFSKECATSTEITNDYITYSFDFEYITV